MGTFQETMSLRTMWAAVSGQHQVPVLVGSLLVYFLAFVICLLLQRSFKLLLPRGPYTFAADFCFTMVVCSYPYSHGTVRHLHGAVGYVIAAVTLVTLSGVFFEGTPSPLGVFRRYLKGAESTFSLAVRIVIQILAAFLSYQLVYFVWSLEVTHEHQNFLKKSACESDLRVPVVLGFLIEFSAVLYDTWLCHQQLVRSALLDTLIKNINGALLVCAGFRLTGMYMHPAMATGMTWNCKGTSTIEHILVYWIAAFLGCYAGGKLHSVFHLPSSSDGAKAAQKKAVQREVTKSRGTSSEKLNNNNNDDKVRNRKMQKGAKDEKSSDTDNTPYRKKGL